MKKIAVLLALVLTTGAKGQVYALEYTTFQLYDTVSHGYHQGAPVNVVAFVDMDKKVLTLLEKQIAYFDVSILKVKQDSTQISFHCFDMNSRKFWDICITNSEHYRILRGKSGNESWIYTLPIK